MRNMMIMQEIAQTLNFTCKSSKSSVLSFRRWSRDSSLLLGFPWYQRIPQETTNPSNLFASGSTCRSIRIREGLKLKSILSWKGDTFSRSLFGTAKLYKQLINELHLEKQQTETIVRHQRICLEEVLLSKEVDQLVIYIYRGIMQRRLLG